LIGVVCFSFVLGLLIDRTCGRAWGTRLCLSLCNTPFTRSSKHQAIIKQTSSKRQANIEQLEHTSCTCILNLFTWCLL